MNRIVGFFICCVLVISGLAQTTRKIQDLEKQHKELQKQISASESLLLSAKQDVKSQLENLALLSGQIDERKKYLAVLEQDMQAVQREIGRMETEVRKLRQEQKKRKNKYDRSLKYMYRNKSVQEKLMFIFSAESLSQIYRRLRYVRQYADYQRLQAMQLHRKEQELQKKQQALEEGRKVKEKMFIQGEQEKAKLEAGELERKELLASLQKRQWEIQAEIRKKRQTADRLNAQIDQLIEQEIERARKEEEERKKKEEELRRQELRRKEAVRRQSLSENKKVQSPTGEEKKIPSSSQTEAARPSSVVRKLAVSFEQNKGHLPVPITGAYVLVGRYGKYQVDGLRNVRLDNKGIDLKGKSGAQARAIFDGEVTAVFQYNGMANVLVRHGNYISVYCNLSSVLVRKGSVLKARDIIGQVNTDADGNTVLHFQLRKETVKLNPELWISL